jgi:hypothetical protein
VPAGVLHGLLRLGNSICSLPTGASMMATFRPCSSFAMLNIHYKRLLPKVVHIPWPASQQRFRASNTRFAGKSVAESYESLPATSAPAAGRKL